MKITHGDEYPLYFSDDLDIDSCMDVIIEAGIDVCTEINKEDAVVIIAHLRKVFELQS